jgi:Uma2 family endonuclease
VHVPFPTRINFHADPHALFVGWLVTYCGRVTGVRVATEGTIKLSEDSQVEPDAFLYRLGQGSRFRITEQGYGEGPPDFVGEIAASSASYDLHSKLRVYERAGVPEYVVWRTEEAAVDWFRLMEGHYVRIEPNANGVIESTVFPGLRLSIPALLSGDYAAVLGALNG